MTKLDDLFALERGDEPEPRPVWVPDFEVDGTIEMLLPGDRVIRWLDPNHPATPDRARLLTAARHRFVTDIADLHRIVVEELRR